MPAVLSSTFILIVTLFEGLQTNKFTEDYAEQNFFSFPHIFMAVWQFFSPLIYNQQNLLLCIVVS